MSDSEQCSKRLRLELDLISILVNFSCELGQIGGSFEKKILSGAKNLIRFYIALNLSCCEKIVFLVFFVIQNLVDIKVADFGDIALCSKERRVV